MAVVSRRKQQECKMLGVDGNGDKKLWKIKK